MAWSRPRSRTPSAWPTFESASWKPGSHMLDELDLDDDLLFGGDSRTPNAVYWEKNYARMRGYVHSFAKLALDESISLYQVSQLQRDLDTALVQYVNYREQQVRKKLTIKALRNSATREPEERASYLAKADELEAELSK
jgi:hypothetical protein